MLLIKKVFDNSTIRFPVSMYVGVLDVVGVCVCVSIKFTDISHRTMLTNHDVNLI